MFSSKARPTWIFVEPLPYHAILSLTSKTLHRTKEDCAELARFVHRASSGNAFSARSILTTLQRQNHVSDIGSPAPRSLLTVNTDQIQHREEPLGVGGTSMCRFALN
jgi:hypothetical protein